MSYYSEISQWSIPIGIGYIWSRAKNSLMVNVGIQIRFNSHFSGYTITPDAEIKKYESFQNSINKHFGISQLDLSALYSRKLTSNFDILLGINGVLPINPDYSIGTYRSKNQLFGLVTGFRYRL